MDFKKDKIIVFSSFLVLLMVLLLLIDYKKSSIRKGEIIVNQFSTITLFDNTSRFIFSTDLFKKNQNIDDFGKHFSQFKFGSIIRYFENKISEFHSGTEYLITNKKVQNFRENYIEFLSKEKKTETLFGITPMHAIFKLDKDCKNLPQPQKAINDVSCKGEWESIQIIVVPFVDTLKAMEVSISNLPFPITNMHCFIGEYAYCRKNKFPTENSGWIADPLIPFDFDSLVNRYKCSVLPAIIPKGETRTIWLNYYIPENMKVGKFSINVSICAISNNKIDKQTTKVNLTVVDYCLSKTMHLKNAFSFNPDAIKQFYNISQIPATKFKQYYRFLLDYHLNPMSLYSPIESPLPSIDDWQWCIDRGANYFNLGYVEDIPNDSVRLLTQFKKTLREKIGELKGKKLFDFAYLYGFDEIKSNKYSNLKFMYKQIRKVDKDIPFSCTVQPVKELSGNVDIWIPEIEAFKENTKLFHKKEKLWEYVCYTNKDVFPNFYTEYAAIDPRIVFWQCSKNNIEGFLYYSVNNWIMFDTPKELKSEFQSLYKTIPKVTSWPEMPWIGHSYRINDGQRFATGDGQLVYPGKNMELYPSTRLINIRDGIEDYEIFYQLHTWQQCFENNGNKNKADLIKAFLTKAYSWIPTTKKEKKSPDELIAITNEAKVLLEECLEKSTSSPQIQIIK
jgi:hypothetical protein